MSSNENTNTNDGGESLTDKISMTRRKWLSVVGAGSGAAAIGSAQSGGNDASLQGGANMANLTKQRLRSQYSTGPGDVFDPGQLNNGELGWASDGRIGVKTDSGLTPYPVGNSSDPVPAVNTEQGSLIGDGPTAIYWDYSNGRTVSEAFGTIQAAIDALPVNDSNITGEGAVRVPSTGTLNPRTNSGAGTAYEENIVIDKKTSVNGLHQHAKLFPDTSTPAVSIDVEEVRFNKWWVDNPSGTAIDVNDSETGIKDVVIDRCADYGINYNGHEMQFLGPNVEVKMGPTVAIRGGRHLHAVDINITQIDGTHRIAEGIVAGQESSIKGVTCFMSRDESTCKTAIKTLGDGVVVTDVLAREPNVDSLTQTGPRQAVEVATNNNDIMGVRTANCLRSVLVSNAVTGNNISGPMQDGVHFAADATQNVINITGGGSITEATTGYANLNVINGLGWDNTGGTAPAVTDWSWRPGVKVWDRGNDTYWQLDGDASAFYQL